MESIQFRDFSADCGVLMAMLSYAICGSYSSFVCLGLRTNIRSLQETFRKGLGIKTIDCTEITVTRCSMIALPTTRFLRRLLRSTQL